MSSTELPFVPPANVFPRVTPVGVEEGERLRSVELPGITLSVRTRPPAREGLPPALYVHGLGGSSRNWSALMPLLDGVVDGEAVDLPGFGDSPPPDDGDYSVTGHARAVIRFLDASDRGPVHLMGNSLGGAVSTRVAALRPDLVRTLTLVSPALPELRVQRTAVPTGLLAVPGVTTLFTRLTREWTAEQRVRGVMALCYGDPGRVTPEGFRNAVREMERRLQLPYFWDAMSRSARGIVDAYTLGGQHGLWRQAARVLAPTLLIYGGRDQLVGFRMAQRAARAFRDSRLLTLPDAGHVAMMEYPETVATAFRELLLDTGDLEAGSMTEPGAAAGVGGDGGVRTGVESAGAEAGRGASRAGTAGRTSGARTGGGASGARAVGGASGPEAGGGASSGAAGGLRADVGRHSRRGPAPKGRTKNTSTGRDDRPPQEGYGPRDGHGPHGGPERWDARENRDGAEPWHGPGGRPGPGAGPNPGPALGQRTTSAGPAGGGPRFQDGTPRFADGTGAPARGGPRLADGTPARGVPRLPDGTPAGGIPPVRGGHPEQRETGGGWGQLGTQGMNGGGAQGPTAAGLGSSTGLVGSTAPTAASVRTRAPIPRQRRASPAGPRQDYLDAFDEDDDVFAPRPRGGVSTANPTAAPPFAPAGQDAVDGGDDTARPAGESVRGTATKGKAFTGIAAAAVTTVLAVVVAGQVAEDQSGAGVLSQSATDRAGPGTAGIAGGDGKAAPSAPPNVSALTYDQKMSTKYPLRPALKGSGRFDAVPGFAKAPGTGRKYTYRVDVEQGLGLDGELFAAAVQKTLNDHRSWAHNGARAFERISSGRPDFVITLASPGTTAIWCAKSGLDTTVDNVSCDSAATERVMINAYRWAQGSQTYGDEMYAYRQMLINHEVGHRLGFGHVTCDKDGAPAPVMQQQTKFLDHDGIHCLPNAWPYPGK